MKRILLFLVYGFAGAGVFTFLEKREETNKEKAMRMLQQLKKNFSMHQDITDEEFERFATAVYKAIRVNKTLDWSYFRAVDFTYSALTTIGKFPFYMFKGETFTQLTLNSAEEALEPIAHEPQLHARSSTAVRKWVVLECDSSSFLRKADLCAVCM